MFCDTGADAGAPPYLYDDAADDAKLSDMLEILCDNVPEGTCGHWRKNDALVFNTDPRLFSAVSFGDATMVGPKKKGTLWKGKEHSRCTQSMDTSNRGNL